MRLAQQVFVVCWGTIALAWFPGIVTGQSNSEAPPTSDLDNELFRDLGGFPANPPIPPARPPDDPSVAPGPTTDPTILPTADTDCWGTLQQQMREVQRRLKRADIGPATAQLQQKIEAGLSDLLHQTSPPSPQSASGAPSGERSPDPPVRRPPSPEANREPAQATPNVAPQPLGSEKLDPRELLQKTWGHLPAHVREQLHSIQPEQFLPEYARQIEQYFRTVSELDRSMPGSP